MSHQTELQTGGPRQSIRTVGLTETSGRADSVTNATSSPTLIRIGIHPTATNGICSWAVDLAVGFVVMMRLGRFSRGAFGGILAGVFGVVLQVVNVVGRARADVGKAKQQKIRGQSVQ